MSPLEILKTAKELNDFVFMSPHDGATKEFFDDKAISSDDQYRIMNTSIRILQSKEVRG